jgi:hypothetical protein
MKTIVKQIQSVQYQNISNGELDLVVSPMSLDSGMYQGQISYESFSARYLVSKQGYQLLEKYPEQNLMF